MAEEWLDPTRADASLAELVLRRRHEAAYAFARRFADGATVVDVACGVGYGAAILGSRPRRYLGVDRSIRALGTAASRAAAGRADFACGDVMGSVPIASKRADLVLAFQIIEHIPERGTAEFLRELRRVCRDGGRVVLTTPNRAHRLLPLQPPWNPYHTREFSRGELDDALRSVFGNVSLRGLRADEEIEHVELSRVRQDPLWVYSRPLFRLMPDRVRTWLEDRLFAESPQVSVDLEGTGASGGPVTVDRFRVEDDPDGKGLDLIAVCRP